MRSKYHEAKKKYEDLLKTPIKVLMYSRYKGVGRPKNSDYVDCLLEDKHYIRMIDMFECGCSTTYTNISKKTKPHKARREEF